ncbi:MAG: methyltransferase [Spirochaetaceae bacterium]|jgi:predicted RNA methylase|nr:methyltransferase [Spirochaetaceae bacterium]
MKINNEVANVLSNSRIEGNKLYLPEGQLDRKLYVSVNKVLVSIKGTWNRSAKAHIFPTDPAEIVDQILLTSEYVDEKKEYQFFETPIPLAERIVEMAEIKKNDVVLEPSAGRGNIAGRIGMSNICHCVELNKENAQFLQSIGFDVFNEDFMAFEPDTEYDVIIANPPFSKQQDIDHVNKMIDIAKRRVVSIMSASVLWRDNKKAGSFRERIKDLGGSFEELPEGEFKESGTNVRTCILVVDV